MNKSILKLETKRLYLIPMTQEFVRKILNNDISAYDDLNIVFTENWPSNDISEILPIILEKLKNSNYADGFNTWLFIDKNSNKIIGDGGFKGAPNEQGVIDLGYGILENERNKGYGFEAVKKLFDWALSHDSVKIITADCSEDNIPSHKILKKLGMKEIKRENNLIYFQYIKTITIEEIKDNKKEYLDLLLLADPEESMIDLYLDSGDMFVLFNDSVPVSVAVIKHIDSETCELKNIATKEEYQNRGYGKALIEYITNIYKDKYTRLIVGTADNGILYYKKNGFTYSHTIKNFFTENYSEPIFDDGIQCIDMIYLKRNLK